MSLSPLNPWQNRSRSVASRLLFAVFRGSVPLPSEWLLANQDPTTLPDITIVDMQGHSSFRLFTLGDSRSVALTSGPMHSLWSGT